jgi:hypothetical protein
MWVLLCIAAFDRKFPNECAFDALQERPSIVGTARMAGLLSLREYRVDNDQCLVFESFLPIHMVKDSCNPLPRLNYPETARQHGVHESDD